MIIDPTWQLDLDDGTRLYGRAWGPQALPIQGIVLILHGMGEHSGRYATFGEYISEYGLLVCAYDQRGHGRTGQETNTRGYLGKEGFFGLADDVAHVIRWLRDSYGEIPVLLFGHSMGSFVAQSYLVRGAEGIQGCVLCGCNGPEGARLWLGMAMAHRYAKKHGPLAESKQLTRLTFGQYNRPFRPIRTPYDWLSRDADVVDAFLADVWCGFPLSAASMGHMFEALMAMYRPSNLQKIPRNLPIFIIAGEVDPVGHRGRGIRKLENVYRRTGLQNILVQLYPGARHELLHEINRLEVFSDVLNWMRAQISSHHGDSNVDSNPQNTENEPTLTDQETDVPFGN